MELTLQEQSAITQYQQAGGIALLWGQNPTRTAAQITDAADDSDQHVESSELVENAVRPRFSWFRQFGRRILLQHP